MSEEDNKRNESKWRENTKSNQSVGERRKEKNIDNSFVLITEHENI